MLVELRSILDLDRPVETWSKDEGYAKIRKGELYTWKGIRVEEIYLDSSVPEHEVIVLLRDLSRPACLFGWRAPAVEPGVLENDLYIHGTVKEAAESHAMVMSVNLEEDLDITQFVKKRPCAPGAVNWF